MAAVALAVSLTSSVSARGAITAEGNEYRVAGNLAGDQTDPAIALKGDGGLLLWQDNTDVSGIGIRGRLLGSQLNGILEPFYVNKTRIGDQSKPSVISVQNGNFLIFWQSAQNGSRKIVGRLLLANGLFGSEEVDYSETGDCRNPVATVLKDGTVVLAWTSNGVDGDMDGIQAIHLSAAGNPIKPTETVNLTTAFNQRDVAVAGLSDGSYAVVWLSEQQSNFGPASVVGRIFNSVGTPKTGELGLVTGKNPSATPAIAAVGSGFVLAWSQFDLSTPQSGWDIYLQTRDSAGNAAQSPVRVNAYAAGSQVSPRVAAAGENLLISYVSDGIDGSGRGIAAHLLAADGSKVGEEFIINRQTRADQFSANLAANESGHFMAVWSTFDSVESGVNLHAQRFGPNAEPLLASTPPYVTGISSSRLLATWPGIEGIGVRHFEVTVDSATSPLITTDNFVYLSGLAPSTTHAVRVAFVLADGRKSPLSLEAVGVTWGEDNNADGLPDDWQVKYFGSDQNAWPSPDVDSDGDGRTNREEFLTGTVPVDSENVLRVSLSAGQTGQILTWNAQVGSMYQVQFSADLKKWQDLGGRHLATEKTNSVPVENAPANVYYRVNFLR